VSNEPRVNRVSRALNKPLNICGVDRRLFFLAALMGVATFNFFGSLLGGLLIFALLYLCARWATATDPQILRVLLNSGKFKVRYDPAKRSAFYIEKIRL
jgi:type IV secretory pathway TrbD component